MRAAVFLERDGILNRERAVGNHWGAPLTAGLFEVNPDAVEPLQALKAAGFLIIATTNQPGLSTGALSRGDLDRMHAILRSVFPLDDILVCPHDTNDFCPCRKPKPGLFSEAAFKWHILLSSSFVVSNKWQDAEAARRIGSTSLLIRSPWIGNGHHDIVLSSLAAAVEKIGLPARALGGSDSAARLEPSRARNGALAAGIASR